MRGIPRILGLVLVWLLTSAPVHLPLPPEARAPLEALRAACPECLAQGILPCGTKEIGAGRRFAANLHQGDPPRGYLLATDYVDRFNGWYRDATLPNAELADRLRALLEQSRLIVVDPGFSALRSLGAPASIEPEIAPRHRACLDDPGAHECRDTECCNKRHGSTAIRATWRDPESGESLEWVHHPAAAQTLLRRGRLAYFCLAWESGKLVAP